MVERLARNWGWVALRGVVAILFGLLTLVNPRIALEALVLWFGIYALADGVFMLVSALANRHGQPHWLALVLGGLLGIAIGLVTFFRPGITIVALLAVIAAWAIVIGIAEVVAALRLRKEITGEWILVVAGLAAVAFGVILVAAPAAGVLAIAVWIGAYALVSGILLVTLSLRLRTWGRLHPASPPTPHPV